MRFPRSWRRTGDEGGAVKRAFDFLAALVLLAIHSPLLLGLALAVRLSSPGPALFRQLRVGKDGVPFRILKFRTMVADAEKRGALLTGKADARITPLGRTLRRLKLDELPQLLNVLGGEMSLVGPRPEDPHFVAHYTAAQKRVLSVRPGVLGISQIVGRNEEEEYPPGVLDLHAYYVEHILPPKLERDLAYIDSQSFTGDLALLFRGAWAVVSGRPPRDLQREPRLATPARAEGAAAE
jgi:lipopolysaccharide/colanic/teichoic acid biosynthesis glycosyltransferase